MKKVITTAMILGSLMNVAGAMNSISSPLYMPKHGDTLLETRLGYYDEDSKYDVYVGTANDHDDEATRWTIREDMRYGIRDDWSFEFGFTFDFNREREWDYLANASDRGIEDDADFHRTYFGVTKRFVNNSFKLDGMTKVYMQEDNNTFADETDVGAAPIERNESVEVAVRAGFEVVDMYDTSLTLGYKFLAEETDSSSTSSSTTEFEVDNQMDWYVKWENQINPVSGLDLGFNVEYRSVDEYERVSKTNGVINVGANSYIIEDHDVWTFDGDINWMVTDAISVGGYVEYTDYDNASVYRLNVNGGAQATPNYTVRDRDSIEYGVKTLVKF